MGIPDGESPYPQSFFNCIVENVEMGANSRDITGWSANASEYKNTSEGNCGYTIIDGNASCGLLLLGKQWFVSKRLMSSRKNIAILTP